MARIRTIKPDFWTDERVGESSPTARLLLIGALNFADDYGSLDRSAKQIKAQVFPYDNIDCESLIRELISNGLLVEYKVGDRFYLHIKGFGKHQKVEKPAKPRFPKYEESLKCTRLLPDSSPTPPLLLTEELRSLREGKGMEGNGMEGSRRGNGGGDLKILTEDSPTPPLLLTEDIGKRAKGPRAHSLPENFILTDDLAQYAIAHGCDPKRTFEKFSTYWWANKKPKVNWSRAFQNWCLNDQDKRQPRKTRFDEINDEMQERSNAH
jgi:hypothetical protein